MINKNNAYNAVTCLYNMLAMLPDTDRPNIKDIEKEYESSSSSDWISDPDGQQPDQAIWQFFRKLSYRVEQSVAKYVSNVQTRRQF